VKRDNRKCCYEHDLGRLLELAACVVDIGHAGDLLAGVVEIDAQYLYNLSVLQKTLFVEQERLRHYPTSRSEC
jgi:hypothetical protein